MLHKISDFKTDFGLDITQGYVTLHSSNIFSQIVTIEGESKVQYSIELEIHCYASSSAYEEGKQYLQRVTKVLSYDPSKSLQEVFEALILN
nr:hypothetical protein K5LAMBDA5_LOCUS201 [Klebsiella phage vB_Ko_K5lambda5]